MNKLGILMAYFTLVGSLQAVNTYVGNLYGATVYFFDDDRAYFGLYQSKGDHTPGSIYIASGMSDQWTIQTLAHELCHLRQDMQGRALNEKECCLKARQGACS